MKKFYTLFVLLVSAAMLLQACGAATDEAPDCTKEDVFCVGLVTDVGKIDDKSFNQSAWEGVQKAVDELGAYAQYIETTDAKDYDKNIATFADAGYDVIVTAGPGDDQTTDDHCRENRQHLLHRRGPVPGMGDRR
jgi:basic membrane protein A